MYDLYETDIALRLSSVSRNIRPSWDYKSALLANAVSVYAAILNGLQSILRLRMDALWSFTYLTILVNCFQCLPLSFSYITRVTCAIREILRTISGLVFASNTSFIFMEVNILSSALDRVCSILLI